MNKNKRRKKEMDRECIRCKRIIIKDFEKWKQENPEKVFVYCKYCRLSVPVMRSEGVDI